MSEKTETMDVELGSRPRGVPLLQQGDKKARGATPSGMTASTEVAMATASEVPETSVEQGKQQSRSQRWWTRVVIGVAVAAIAMAVASMAWEGSYIAIIAFIFPLISGPYVIYQRKALSKLPTLTFVINQTRHQVNRLSTQNTRFTKENDRLSAEVEELKDLEQKFHTICQKSGTNVNEMKKLINENGEIQKQMKKIQDAQQLQDIFSAIMRSDTNQDFKITETELDRLMLRLKGYSVVDQEHLKDTLRLWVSKSDMEEFKKLEKESESWL